MDEDWLIKPHDDFRIKKGSSIASGMYSVVHCWTLMMPPKLKPVS